MSEARREEFDVGGGVQLVADVLGDGARGVVLLAHGGGQTRHSWSGTARRLASEGWQTVAVDLRGHGESSWAADGDYGIDRFATDLAEVGGRFSDRPHLIGASLGGLAGLVAASSVAPGAFRSLTLVDIVPRTDPSGVAKVMGFMNASLEEGFESLEAAADAITAYLPHRPRPTDLSGLNKNLRRGEDGRYRWHWDPRFATGVRRGRDAHDVDAFEDRTTAITIPVHLIRGRLSELVTREAAEAFVSKLPNARLTDVAGAAHMIAGDRNDVFAAAVIAFLSALDG